jgi:ADP-ribosylglycohydrolase
MLFECAIGDSYGFGFEYADENLPLNTLDRYVKHPTYGRLRPGQYTDDTQMSIAIAEALVDGIQWEPYPLAQKFVEVFKRDPRDGYSKGFQAILESVNTGVQLIGKLTPSVTSPGLRCALAPSACSPTAPRSSHARSSKRASPITPPKGGGPRVPQR